MKTDFTINVRVLLEVTPSLESLVAKLLTGIPVKTAVENTEAPKQQSEQTEPKQEEQPATEPETAPEQEAPKELTEADIREAIHKTRQRIEGMDYKDHPDGEMYKKYHKNLTAAFKNIASLLGADKPSALPADKRAAFISECQQLQALDEFGKIGKPEAF